MTWNHSNLECLWIEIQLNHTRVIFGLFYCPQTLMRHTSLALKILYYNLHWIHKSTTSLSQATLILISWSNHTSRKIFELRKQFSFHQTVTEPTHYTENSSSHIDIILTSDKSKSYLQWCGRTISPTRYLVSLPILWHLQIYKAFGKTHLLAESGVTTEGTMTYLEPKLPIPTGIHYPTLTSIPMPSTSLIIWTL